MAILKCSECGNVLDENDKVCGECGCPIYVHPNKKINKSETKRTTIRNVDRDIEKTFASLLIYGEVFKWIIAAVSIIVALMLFFDENNSIIGLVVLIVGLITSFLSSMMFKWMGYSLKCLYDIRNDLNK